MSLSVEQLSEEALALPASDRAELAERLAESLDPVDNTPLRQAWTEEALRCRDEVRSGRVQTVPGAEALRQARQAATQ